MPRTRSILLVPLLAATLAGAGCSTTIQGTAAPVGLSAADSTAPGGGGSGGGSSDETVAWMNEVCGAMLPFARTTAEPPAFSTTGDLDETLAAMDEYFAEASESVDTTIAALEAVGPSPVPEGDELVQGLTQALTAVKALYSSTGSDLDSPLGGADPGDLSGGLPPGPGSLGELPDIGNPGAELAANPELQAAAEQAANCREMKRITTG